MAKTLSNTLIFAVAIVQVADAIRKKDQATSVGKTVKCKASGTKDRTEGMEITWGSQDPVHECSVVRQNDAEGLTYEYKFTEAFSIGFSTETRKCECSIGVGSSVVTLTTFRPAGKGKLHQAKVCQGTAEEASPMESKKWCWERYKRARGTRLSEVGSIAVAEYTEPWLSGDFAVNGRGGPCEGEACNSITLPGALGGKTRKHKQMIGEAIKKVMDGQRDQVPKTLLDMIEVLTNNDLDECEFETIDTDDSNALSLDELTAYYTQFVKDYGGDKIEQFIAEVDNNGNGEVDRDEFGELKEKMRNYAAETSDVDLIDGAHELKVAHDGTIMEVEPEWKVATVKCMKGGVEVAIKECDGEQADAIHNFNTNC